MEPEQADRVVDVYRIALLPVMQDYDGFCSASLLVGVLGDLRQPRSHGAQPREGREAGAREAGVEILEVCEFELALAHLRVPEMA